MEYYLEIFDIQLFGMAISPKIMGITKYSKYSLFLNIKISPR